ncbi:MAG: tetratricopeptide repeat protein [Lentimicrobiaceae bacterium]|nr:tetratricopeptide repeat protein [Lentimicrobiaceae bacterium]
MITLFNKFLNTLVNNLYCYIFVFLIVALSFLPMINALKCGFVNLDDNIYIYENSLIRHLSWNTFFNFFSGNIGQYPPLVMFIYSVIYHYFELNPFYYHFVNLLLHTCNSVLVFIFIYRFHHKLIAATITGLLFAVHPLHVESVVWATELKDVLYTFFFIGGLLAYQSYSFTNKKIKYLIISFFFFVFSCFSKGMAVVFPLILLLIDYLIDGKINWKKLPGKIPFFVFALFWGYLTFITQNETGAVGHINSVAQRLFIACYGFLFYIVKMVVPINLSVFYPAKIQAGVSLPFIYLVSPVFLLMLILIVLYFAKYSHIIIFGFLFYLFTVILILQLIPVGFQVTAERYFYLSSVGLFMIVGYMIDYCIRYFKKHKYIILGVSGIVILLLAIKTDRQTKIWKNSLSLWNNALYDAGNYSDYAFVYTNRGDAYGNLGDYNSALRDYSKAIELDPGFENALNNRGVIKGILRDYEGAKIDFDAVLALHPDYVKALNNRGNIYRFLGDFPHAFQDFSKAITIKPDYWDAYLNRGIISYFSGNLFSACADWKKIKNAGSPIADELLLKYCNY